MPSSEHGKPAELLAECGLDADGIEAAIRRRLEGADAAAIEETR